jgi:hypothetical protein
VKRSVIRYEIIPDPQHWSVQLSMHLNCAHFCMDLSLP